MHENDRGYWTGEQERRKGSCHRPYDGGFKPGENKHVDLDDGRGVGNNVAIRAGRDKAVWKNTGDGTPDMPHRILGGAGGGATAEMVFVRSIGIGMGTHLGKAQLEEEE
jgi:hypothetical protein